MDIKEFFDVKTNTTFKTEDYRIIELNNRKFAVAKSPNGDHECWLVIKEQSLKIDE